jgi:hypothetical protein
LAAAECIDVIEGAVALLERIREDAMGDACIEAKEIAVVQEALRGVIARLEEIHDGE